MVASIKGTLSKDIIVVLEKLSTDKRLEVKEVTLDMAKNMEAAVKTVFTKATLVTDRFHVVKLAMEALQHIRINKRWQELDIENQAIEQSKKENRKYEPLLLENGDTQTIISQVQVHHSKKERKLDRKPATKSYYTFQQIP